MLSPKSLGLGFELKCSNILNSKIPSSNVLDFFKSARSESSLNAQLRPGGACNISANDDLLKPAAKLSLGDSELRQVVDRETLHRLEADRVRLHGTCQTSALPMGLAMPWSFRNCQCLILNSASQQGTRLKARLKAARDFLNATWRHCVACIA